MIKPTVGRVVHFWQHGSSHGTHDQPEMAQIVYVHSDRCVNLVIHDHVGVARPQTSVELLQDDDPRPDWSFCEWMPFQKGQAPASDALVARVAALESRLPQV